MPKEFTPQQILSLPIEPGHHGATTIGQYLAVVLRAYWVQNAQFDIDQPLGVSGWKVPIRNALREAGAIDKESFNTSPFLDDAIDFLTKADFTTVEEYKEPEDWYVINLDVNSNDAPVIRDSYAIGFTEKDAKAKADYQNIGLNRSSWIAVQIPKAS